MRVTICQRLGTRGLTQHFMNSSEASLAGARRAQWREELTASGEFSRPRPQGLTRWGKEPRAYAARTVGNHCSDSNRDEDYMIPF